MPSPVERGFVEYLAAQLASDFPGISVYDGEIPRFNTSGNPVTLDGPPPVFRCVMEDRGFKRQWTFVNAYEDEGPLNFEGWTPGRDGCMTLLNAVETLLVNSSNWPSIVLPGGPSDNPYSVNNVLMLDWTCIPLEGVRAQSSQLIYYGRLTFKVGVHGSAITR
jgi:hypothetical protein